MYAFLISKGYDIEMTQSKKIDGVFVKIVKEGKVVHSFHAGSDFIITQELSNFWQKETYLNQMGG